MHPKKERVLPLSGTTSLKYPRAPSKGRTHIIDGGTASPLFFYRPFSPRLRVRGGVGRGLDGPKGVGR